MPGSESPWFFHARTGGTWLLDVTFRVPSRSFNAAEVRKLVPLQSLDERNDLPIYGKDNRVSLRHSGRLTDDIRMLIHNKSEIATPGAKMFIKRATQAYQRLIRKMAEDIETRQPWKANGRLWHLSQQAVPRNQRKAWAGSLMVQLLGRIKKIDPTIKEDWTQKVTVSLRHPNVSGIWAKFVTNNAFGLRVEVRCARGQFTPARIERLGLTPDIHDQHGHTCIRFWVQNMQQCDNEQLESLIRESIEGLNGVGAVGLRIES